MSDPIRPVYVRTSMGWQQLAYQGPPGPPGPPGIGTGDKNFVYNQLSPSTNWPVTHNLGKFVSVEVVDSGGSTIIPDIHYNDNNNVTLLFGSATSGKAYFN